MCLSETEVDHLIKMFQKLGTPNEDTWPEFSNVRKRVSFVFMICRTFRKKQMVPDYLLGLVFVSI